MLYDLKNDKYIETKESIGLKFLYNTLLGRLILKIAISKWVTSLYAKYMNSHFSCHKIKKFIKNNNIDMSIYKEENYSCFNDFFMRRIKDNARKIESDVFSVCDSKLSVYEIEDGKSFKIKNSFYTIDELIQDDSSKHNYKYALIFRLCVDDYHHYVFPDDGKIISSKYIKGKFHTVRPIALKKDKVFIENSRCVTYLDCKNMKDVCFIEVGALMVGKIVNEDVTKFKKGEEKGHFEFGGSTIVMLVEDNVKINELFIQNTKKDIETIVKLGTKLD